MYPVDVGFFTGDRLVSVCTSILAPIRLGIYCIKVPIGGIATSRILAGNKVNITRCILISCTAQGNVSIVCGPIIEKF